MNIELILLGCGLVVLVGLLMLNRIYQKTKADMIAWRSHATAYGNALSDVRQRNGILVEEIAHVRDELRENRTGLANLLSIASMEKRPDGLYSVLFTEELLRDIGVPISSPTPTPV